MGGGGGDASASAKAEAEEAIFQSQRINFTPPEPIQAMCAASNVLVLGLSKGSVLRIPLESAQKQVQLPSPLAQGDSLALLSLDPSGSHLLLSTASGDNFYFHPSLRPPAFKPLAKLKGNVLTAVAWNRPLGNDAATSFIVLGTSRGLLFETSLDSGGGMAYLKQLHALATDEGARVAVGALRLERCAEDRWALWAATPGQLWPFLGTATGSGSSGGGGGWAMMSGEAVALGGLFASSGRSQNLDPTPASGAPCALTAWAEGPDSPATRQAWLAAPGILHGRVAPDSDDPFRLVLDESLYKHPELNGRAEWPLGIAQTQHHLLLLYSNRLVAVSALAEEVAYEDVLGAKFGRPVGIVRDAASGLVWLHTDRSVLRYKPVREGRYVWRVHMARKEWSLARKYAKESGREEDVREVCEAEASWLLANAKPTAAAEMLALSGAPFEPAALKLIQEADRPALRVFLERRLAALAPSQKAEATMLSLWLLELHLTELGEAKSGVAPAATSPPKSTPSRNPFEEEEAKTPSPSPATVGFDHQAYRQQRKRLQSFLRQPKVLEHLKATPESVYQMMTAHGDLESLRYFGQLMGDARLVLRLLLEEGQREEALKVLEAEADAELYQAYSAKLLQGRLVTAALALKMSAAWKEMGPRLAPKLLLPAMFQADDDPTVAEAWLSYLEHCINRLGSREPAIHNYAVSLYARHGLSERLLAYLRKEGRDGPYDLKYALRLCRERGLHEAAAEILTVLGLWEEAVAAAIAQGDLGLAKRLAAQPEAAESGGEELAKRLWLSVGEAVVGEGGEMEEAMALLSASDGRLKIQDILPFFPNYATIHHFKESLCQCLADHSQRIAELDKNMAEATEVSDEIRDELKELKGRALQIRPSDACASECGDALLSRPFYAFPCRHAFHTDCIQRELASFLQPEDLLKLTNLKQQLLNLASASAQTESLPATSRQGWALPGRSFFPPSLGGGSRGGGHARGPSDADAASLSGASVGGGEEAAEAELRKALDELLGAECPWCGEAIIQATAKPFHKPAEYAKLLRSWNVG